MKSCRITISVYFAVFIACILVLDHTGLAVLALLCAAFHEAGHFLALRMMKMPVKEVSFKIFGVGIKLSSSTRMGYGQEIAVALSGCAANLLLCLLSLLVNRAGFFAGQSQAFGAMNLILCGFNLLPIGPLDGGRALQAFLYAHMRIYTARRIVDAVSAVLIVPLVFFGVYLVALTRYNFSLILAALYLAAAMLLKGRLIEID